MYIKNLKTINYPLNVLYVKFADTKHGRQGVVKRTGSMDRTTKRMQAIDRKPS